MLPELLQKKSLFRLLYQLDLDISNQQKQQGCPYCDGALHVANYPREPRGGPDNILDEYLIRLSFCCGQEGCRKRKLSPSCRFLGPKVYWAAAILVVMALRQNRPEGKSIGKLKKCSVFRIKQFADG